MTTKLSGRELDVMKVLWESPKPLVASEIAQMDSSISINTIHQVLKTLMKKNFIEVSEIVYSGTVLSRRYKPTIELVDYIKENFFFKSTLNVLSSFIEKENDKKIIDELSDLLKKKKEELGDY